MRGRLAILLLVGVAFATGDTFSHADSRTRGVGRQPLDIPVVAAAAKEDEEDRPETILFWGNEYEANVFLFCFPAFDF